MAGTGRKFKFHGAFKKKSAAKRKESSCDCFIRRKKVRGVLRYFVLERR